MVLGIIALPGMDMACVMASALAGGRRMGFAAMAGIVAGGLRAAGDADGFDHCHDTGRGVWQLCLSRAVGVLLVLGAVWTAAALF